MSLTNYGIILGALKRHEEALASFDKVLALRGNDAAAHYNRGNTLAALDRHRKRLPNTTRC